MDSTVYTNRSYHLGINQRTHGRLLDDNEATDLVNVDITVPGVRTKRLEPTVVTTLTIPPNGVFQICEEVPYETLTPTLFWTAAGGVTGFRVQIFDAGFCGGNIINDSGLLPPTVFSYTVPPGVITVIGDLYSWKVIAYGDGVNTPDVEACCRLRVLNAPCLDLAAPTITFPPTNPYTFTENPVTINWSNVVNAVGYVVHFYQGTTEVHTSPILPQGTFAYLTSLLPFGTYTVTVQAIGDGSIWCDSAESTDITIETPCSYALDPTGASHTVFSGLGIFHVETGPDCSWTASSNSAWITLPGLTSGTGPGDVAYLYECNPDLTARTGSITAAGLTFTVNQDGPSISLDPASASWDADGGSSTFAVDSDGCTDWTAVSNNPSWLHVDSGTPHTTNCNDCQGDGTVGYTVDCNSSASPRTGTITAAGETFTVTQAGAALSITPSGLVFGAGGGTGLVTVNGAGCWTAASDVGWITINSGSSGSGGDTTGYTVDANTGGLRTGHINYSFGDVHTVTQQAYPNLPSTPFRWLRPESLAGTYANGASISTWVDEGTANDDGYAEYGTGPVYQSNVINGYGAARFDGTQSGLSNSGGSTDPTSSTLFLVCRFHTSSSGKYVLSGDGPGGRAAIITNGSSGFYLWATGNPQFNTSVNQWVILAIDFNDTGGTYNVYMNGATIATGVTALAPGDVWPDAMGAHLAGGSYSDFAPVDIAELAAYDGIMNSSDRAAAFLALNTKYAVY